MLPIDGQPFGLIAKLEKEAIAKDYAARLQAVDKSITDTISTQARLKGYNMVISKGVVVYGGDDITADVQKVVK